MKFIFNFFFFGLLFYLIWMFFPEAFRTLVSWADQAVFFLKDIFHTLSERWHSQNANPVPYTPARALLVFPWM